MCIRDRLPSLHGAGVRGDSRLLQDSPGGKARCGYRPKPCGCLLYTSDAADERSSVDLGGRRIIKKNTNMDTYNTCTHIENTNHDRS